MKYELQNKNDMRMSLQSQQNTITYIKSMEATQDNLDGGLRSPSHDLETDGRPNISESHGAGQERVHNRHNSDYQQMLEQSRQME